MIALVSHAVGCDGSCGEPRINGKCIHDPAYWKENTPKQYIKWLDSLPEHISLKISNEVDNLSTSGGHMMHPDSFKKPDYSGGFKK